MRHMMIEMAQSSSIELCYTAALFIVEKEYHKGRHRPHDSATFTTIFPLVLPDFNFSYALPASSKEYSS